MKIKITTQIHEYNPLSTNPNGSLPHWGHGKEETIRPNNNIRNTMFRILAIHMSKIDR